MSSLNRIDCHSPSGVLYGYEFKCPGCGNSHVLPVGPGNGSVHARWDFNGNLEKPTFTPSVLAQGNKRIFDEEGDWTGDWQMGADGNPIPYICHSFITDGRIQFLSDCTHELAGQTVGLPEWPERSCE